MPTTYSARTFSEPPMGGDIRRKKRKEALASPGYGRDQNQGPPPLRSMMLGGTAWDQFTSGGGGRFKVCSDRSTVILGGGTSPGWSVTGSQTTPTFYCTFLSEPDASDRRGVEPKYTETILVACEPLFVAKSPTPRRQV